MWNRSDIKDRKRDRKRQSGTEREMKIKTERGTEGETETKENQRARQTSKLFIPSHHLSLLLFETAGPPDVLWYETKDSGLWRGCSRLDMWSHQQWTLWPCCFLPQVFPMWVVVLIRGHQGHPQQGKPHRSRWFDGKKNWLGKQNQCEDMHL